MDIKELRAALQRSGLLIFAVTVMCVTAAITYTARMEPRYESKIQLFIASPGPNFSIQRAPSYAQLVKSPYVTSEIVRDLKLPGSGRDLAARLSASAPAGTALLNVTVPDASPLRAQQIATAVGNKLVEYVPGLERRSESATPFVRLSINSPASLSSTRVSPNARVNVAAGLMFGLLIGLLAAVGRQLVDRRVVSPEDLPAGPGRDLLAAVPADDKIGTLPVLGLGVIAPERAEALRRLRTNLRFLEPEQPSQTIVITSATADEGTSTTAVGLAVAIADAGAHVILVDANLRRPRVGGMLGLSASDGVSAQLGGGTPVGELLRRVYGAPVGGGLEALVAGALPSNPSELLSSGRMPELLEDLRARCDVVLIDAPPLL